jgi:hypothetical protein
MGCPSTLTSYFDTYDLSPGSLLSFILIWLPMDRISEVRNSALWLPGHLQTLLRLQHLSALWPPVRVQTLLRLQHLTDSALWLPGHLQTLFRLQHLRLRDLRSITVC